MRLLGDMLNNELICYSTLTAVVNLALFVIKSHVGLSAKIRALYWLSSNRP